MAAAIAPGPSRRAAAARAAEQRGRSRVGLLTAAGVILVVLIGAGAALYLRSVREGASGPPPVIAADEGAVRVEPLRGSGCGGWRDGWRCRLQPRRRHCAGDGRAGRRERRGAEGDRADRPSAARRRPMSRLRPDERGCRRRIVGQRRNLQPAAAPAASAKMRSVRGKVPTFVVRADGSIVGNERGRLLRRQTPRRRKISSSPARPGRSSPRRCRRSLSRDAPSDASELCRLPQLRARRKRLPQPI